MRVNMEKQRIKKDDGRYQIFYSFGAENKQTEKEAPNSTTSDENHVSTSRRGKDS
jgi:hypothetical protein